MENNRSEFMNKVEGQLLEKQRKILKFTAKALYQAGLYENSMEYFKQVIDMDSRLSDKQRLFFSNLIQAILSPYRNALKQLRDSMPKEISEKNEILAEMIKKIFDSKFESLKLCCHDILSIIDQQILPGNPEPETRIDMLRIQGDLYRYIVEFSSPDQTKFYATRADSVYKEAYKEASMALPPHSLTRLAIVLNRSILLAEMLNMRKEAVDFVETEIQALMSGNSELDESAYQKAVIFTRKLNNKVLQWRE